MTMKSLKDLSSNCSKLKVSIKIFLLFVCFLFFLSFNNHEMWSNGSSFRCFIQKIQLQRCYDVGEKG